MRSAEACCKDKRKLVIVSAVKFLLLSFLCIALAILLSGSAKAADSMAYGRCGDNLTWTLDEDGVLTISGTGDMWDYDNNKFGYYTPWYEEHYEQFKSLAIEESVTHIGNHAFSYCSGFDVSLIIPKGVEKSAYMPFESAAVSGKAS